MAKKYSCSQCWDAREERGSQLLRESFENPSALGRRNIIEADQTHTTLRMNKKGRSFKVDLAYTLLHIGVCIGVARHWTFCRWNAHPLALSWTAPIYSFTKDSNRGDISSRAEDGPIVYRNTFPHSCFLLQVAWEFYIVACIGSVPVSVVSRVQGFSKTHQWTWGVRCLQRLSIGTHNFHRRSIVYPHLENYPRGISSRILGAEYLAMIKKVGYCTLQAAK